MDGDVSSRFRPVLRGSPAHSLGPVGELEQTGDYILQGSRTLRPPTYLGSGLKAAVNLSFLPVTLLLVVANFSGVRTFVLEVRSPWSDNDFFCVKSLYKNKCYSLF